jgi:hypothetical protein
MSFIGKESAMKRVPDQDSRGFFVLPQAPEEAAYYTYGAPVGGAGQYAHARMLTFIFLLEHKWGAIDDRKIGIGNISVAGGVTFEKHNTHKSGLEVDIRALRKDGRQIPVRYTELHYDQAATRRMVETMWQTGMVKRIYFNDVAIPLVQRLVNHDNHLHVEVLA